MKRVEAPITVEVEEESNQPRLIEWEGTRIHVSEMLGAWVLQSRWWGDEERRIYYRLSTSRGVMDVYRSGERWVLSRWID